MIRVSKEGSIDLKTLSDKERLEIGTIYGLCVLYGEEEMKRLTKGMDVGIVE